MEVYERVRSAVVEITGRPGETAAAAGGADASPHESAPSQYWSEELENIDYMIEASPLIIRKLRHHAYHISNVRPYDYRIKADAKRENFEARLRALQALDPGQRLLIPESPALGGFGYEIDGRLFNVDTLKFYEVLIGMERGGVLPALRARERPVVCEIGAGWAGFAYQFRTLFPSCRYVIVDFAELFLFSATYLGTLFPGATMAFCGTAATPGVADAGDADFIFVPHTMAAQVSSLPLDLTLNMVSFQEMTDRQVRAYADMAGDAGCAWLYSFNRERSPFNTEIGAVTAALEHRYALTEVPVMPTDYTTVLKKPPKAGKHAERSEFNYRHVVGRLAPSATWAARSRVTASVVTGASSGASGASSGATGDGPRVVLGMTLYNKAAFLPHALDSILGQTYRDFRLVLLDDASSDATESIARQYAAHDDRITYVRHDARQAMVATWREVVDIAAQACPSAEYFAWASDHDRWHPRWLDRLLGEIERHPQAVLVYPITRRIGPDGAELDKGPREFDTAGLEHARARWSRFCRHGIGSGDMVYGLMRLGALREAGVFRRVLRPDRLLIAELTLRGQFLQVPEVLWFRRDSEGASVDRQRHSLFLAGDEPTWFAAPPWWQHAVSLWRTYAGREPGLRLSRLDWIVMLAQYQLTYGWRHFRKTEASHAVGRGIDNVIWVKKLGKHYWHHAVYRTLVGGRAVWGRTRRLGRRGLYEALMLTHRLGLRRGSNVESR